MLLDLLGKCIGEEAKYEGIKLLFDGLQQPVLNKQVSGNIFASIVKSAIQMIII